MEEILSSIRRIIAEEEHEGGGTVPASGPTSPRRAPSAEGPAARNLRKEEDEDVLELTEVVTAGDKPAAPAAPATAAAAPGAAPPAAAAGSRPAAMPNESIPMAAGQPDSLVSSSTANASAQALARLTRAAGPDDRKASAASGVTMEQLLVELLTPMLKDWLDAHLPEVVERVVEQEVKKLARRAELM